MEKKANIIALIAIALLVIGTALFIIFSGLVAGEYNYVQIEVNPRVEFLCDKKYKVVSAYPLNEDARIVISDMDFVGMDVDDATTSFINECARCGFIDVDGKDNATNITIIDGITQALDVHVTQKVYDYYRSNEILCAVTETYEDRSIFDEKKENNASCSNKYKLIKTLHEQDENLAISDLAKLNEIDLVKLVKARHDNNPYVPTDFDVLQKQELKNSYASKYANHLIKITDETQREFSSTFEKFQKEEIKPYTINFEKEYYNWQENTSL